MFCLTNATCTNASAANLVQLVVVVEKYVPDPTSILNFPKLGLVESPSTDNTVASPVLGVILNRVGLEDCALYCDCPIAIYPSIVQSVP